MILSGVSMAGIVNCMDHNVDQRIFHLSMQIISEDILLESDKTPVLAGKQCIGEIPYVVDFLCYKSWNYFKYGDEFYFPDTYYANTSILLNASVDLVLGSIYDALAEPNTVIISESTASQLFGKAYPLENTMIVNGQKCVITGVFIDLPKKAMIKTDIIVSYATLMNEYTNDRGLSDFELSVKPEVYTDIILQEGYILPATEDKRVIYHKDISDASDIHEKLSLEIQAEPIPQLHPEVDLVFPYKKIKDPGFNAAGVFIIPVPWNADPDMLTEFKVESMMIPYVFNASGSSSPFLHEPDVLVYLNGTDQGTCILSVGYDFIELMQLELVEGRSFSSDFPQDNRSALVNKAFVEGFGTDEIIGKSLLLNVLEKDGMKRHEMTVTGILADFYFPSNPSLEKPVIITLDDNIPEYLFIKVNPEQQEQALISIKNIWEKLIPDFPCRLMSLFE